MACGCAIRSVTGHSNVSLTGRWTDREGPGERPGLSQLSRLQAASVAACSLAFLHSAAASMEISVLVPTRITAGPHPCRLILKNMSSEMRCAVQNSRIDIASAFGSALGGLRRYF